MPACRWTRGFDLKVGDIIRFGRIPVRSLGSWRPGQFGMERTAVLLDGRTMFVRADADILLLDEATS